ncbi:MAG: NTP transferase domain-containing protein, partial [Candidatus Omnitrophica bacterium]|nr:NTP transferase domain-containing protein [Candidatus Omnitrophota bacterium]MBD3269027.1 NTP transferase domain-containing protein [Candidatus Omnitrophota bacterium]
MRKKNGFSAVVLAAGKGKRMKSGLPKVLHELAGRPLLFHLTEEIISLSLHIKEVIFVMGFKGGLVERETKEFLKSKKSLKRVRIKFVYQKNMLGTGHALNAARKYISEENT